MSDEDNSIFQFERGYQSPYIYPEQNELDTLEVELSDDLDGDGDFDLFDFLF